VGGRSAEGESDIGPIIDTATFANIALRINPIAQHVFPMQGMLPTAPRLPSLCLICHSWPSQPLCALCMQRFAQPKRRCRTCALALADAQPCSDCAEYANPLDACVAAVSYTFPWSNCIARFKFQADPGLARALANLMRHAPWIEPALEAATLIVPMPIAPARLRERGFNQALELARHLAPDKTDGHILLRHSGNAHQVGATREGRLEQVSDAFWVASKRLASVRGQSVVLIDDVMTTGASIYEAARVLRAVGAAHITGMVLARAEQRESTD
jgi:ComF family protein